MSFSKQLLRDSWFNELELARVGISKGRIPDENGMIPWQCALDRQAKMLFTQLISSSGEMRGGVYYYLLAIKRDLLLIMWECGKAQIVTQSAINKYSFEFLVERINEAAIVLTVDKQPFSFISHT